MSQKVHRDKEVHGIVDRARMSWILNLVLNQKTQQEIVKDIADGILDFKEIEDIFPWKFVQQLRQYTPEHVQDYLNRFKNMTDERIHGLLNVMLRRKSRDEILKLINNYSLNLDNIQTSYLRRHMEENEEDESSTTPNVSTSSEKLSSKDSNNIEIQNSKKSKDLGTKKKRNAVKKGEDDAETKKRGNIVEKVEKKVKVVKLKNEKRVGSIKGGNKVEEASKEISSTEKNPLHCVDSEKAQGDLTESLMQTNYKESLLKHSQENQATYKSSVQRNTKKTVNSKSLANDDAKLAGAKKASKKVGKDVKSGTRNKRKGEVENFASLLRSDNYIEEEEKSKCDESEIENARTSYAMRNDFFPEASSTEGFQNSLQKSNQVTNITSITSQEQDIYKNHVQENDFNIQVNTSTPKKLNSEMEAIRIKEEPNSTYSFNEFDYPDENCQEMVLNICKDTFKKVDSQKKLQTKRNNARESTKLSNADGTQLEKISGPSKITKAEKHRDCAQKEDTTERKAKNTRHKESNKGTENRRSKVRSLDRKNRRKREELRKNQKKIQKAMARFNDQVAKIVKKMENLEKDDESSYSSSSESYCSTSESCSCSCSSCSCCDYDSSDEYSEYTLCSCSNCCSSCSSTDSDFEREE